MAKGLVNESSLNSIAEAINVLNGTEGTYLPSEMGAAIIDAIPTETASGNPIHITDAAHLPAESVVTTLEPVQDLHGYDKPWPAGGGKNKYPYSENLSGDTWGVNSGGGYNITNNVLYISCTSTTWSGVFCNGTALSLIREQSVDVTVSFDVKANVSTNIFALRATVPVTTNFVRQSVTVSANDTNTPFAFYGLGTAVNLEIKNICISYDENTTYEPYSNECPISGHTGVELTRTGKNLLPNEITSFEERGITFLTQNDGGIKITGTAKNEVYSNAICRNFELPEGTYILSATGLENINIQICNRAGTAQYFAIDNVTPSRTIQITKTIASDMWVRFIIHVNATLNTVVYPMIRLATVADPTFEPYTPETHAITFPQAQSSVYGCEVDWVQGVLRVTEVNVDLGTLNWGLTSRGYFQAALSNVKRPSTDAELADIKCSIYKTDTSYNIYYGATDKAVCIAVNTDNVWVLDSDYSSASSFKAAMSGVQLVYELATPLEIPLTPEIITLLKGENNVWTDAGTSEIEYKVDLNSYIQKLIDEASASTLNVSPLSLDRSAVRTSTDEESGEEEEVNHE